MMIFERIVEKIGEPPVHSPCTYYFYSSYILPVRYYSPFSIRYIKEGTVETTIDGKKAILDPGSVLIVKPGSFVESRSVAQITGISIFFDNNSYKDIVVANEPFFSPFDLNSKSHQRFKNLVAYLDGCLSNRKRSSELVERVKANLNLDLQALRRQLYNIPRKKLSTKLELLNRIEEVRLVLQHVDYKFNLEELADGVCMSKYALVRSFKAIYRQTPKQYHITQKIAVARRLLKGETSVKEVALRCGYPDIFSFSKQFRKREGMPPSELK